MTNEGDVNPRPARTGVDLESLSFPSDSFEECVFLSAAIAPVGECIRFRHMSSGKREAQLFNFPDSEFIPPSGIANRRLTGRIPKRAIGNDRNDSPALRRLRGELNFWVGRT